MTYMEYVSLIGLFVLVVILTYRQIRGRNIQSSSLTSWVMITFLWILLVGLIYVQYDVYQKEMNARPAIKIETR